MKNICTNCQNTLIVVDAINSFCEHCRMTYFICSECQHEFKIDYTGQVLCIECKEKKEILDEITPFLIDNKLIVDYKDNKAQLTAIPYNENNVFTTFDSSLFRRNFFNGELKRIDIEHYLSSNVLWVLDLTV